MPGREPERARQAVWVSVNVAARIGRLAAAKSAAYDGRRVNMGEIVADAVRCLEQQQTRRAGPADRNGDD